MVKFYSNPLKPIYACEIWLRSTDLNNLDLCRKTLPKSFSTKRLSSFVKRFTLLRSPLGNKKSKDQYEYKEYGIYIFVQAPKASVILSLLEILYLVPGIKAKILVSKLWE